MCYTKKITSIVVKIMEEYRLVMQYKNPEGRFINNDIIISGKIMVPKEIVDLGLRHTDQIEILQKIQDSILVVRQVF